MAGFILMIIDLEADISGLDMAWVSWGIAVFAGLTMVSNVPFYSFKDVNFRKPVPFIGVFLIALGLALIAIKPAATLWPLFAAYGLSGYVVAAWRAAKGKKVSLIQTDMDSDDPSERH
jgi:CDP-diacylglycerol--serine O-phosphatidyltransferase